MYHIISYTVHITTNIVLAIILKTHGDSEDTESSSYLRSLRQLGTLMLFNVPLDVVMFYLHTCGHNESELYPVLIPFYIVILIGIAFEMFYNFLRTPIFITRWQSILMWLFIIVFLIHPVVFTQTYFSRNDEVSTWIVRYKEFLNSDIHAAYLIIFYATGVANLLLSMVNLIIFERQYYLWYKFYNRKNKLPQFLTITLLLILAIALITASFVSKFVYGYAYYIDLPLWSAFLVLITMLFLNNKKLFADISKESLKLQIEYLAAKTIYNKSLGKLTSEENLHRREQAVILFALNTWLKTNVRLWLNKDITLATVSSEIGVPAAAVIKQINSTYGFTFNEYVVFLRKRVQNLDNPLDNNNL